jgi:hypothetical protein
MSEIEEERTQRGHSNSVEIDPMYGTGRSAETAGPYPAVILVEMGAMLASSRHALCRYQRDSAPPQRSCVRRV